MAPTTLRNVRVDDDLWSAAQTRAETEGTTVSDVIRAALETYVCHHSHDGQPINVRLGDELLAQVDARAAAEGVSRAEMVRALVTAGLWVA